MPGQPEWFSTYFLPLSSVQWSLSAGKREESLFIRSTTSTSHCNHNDDDDDDVDDDDDDSGCDDDDDDDKSDC